MIQDANALLARYQHEAASLLTRALVAEQALAEADAITATLRRRLEDLEVPKAES